MNYMNILMRPYHLTVFMGPRVRVS